MVCRTIPRRSLRAIAPSNHTRFRRWWCGGRTGMVRVTPRRRNGGGSWSRRTRTRCICTPSTARRPIAGSRTYRGSASSRWLKPSGKRSRGVRSRCSRGRLAAPGFPLPFLLPFLCFLRPRFGPSLLRFLLLPLRLLRLRRFLLFLRFRRRRFRHARLAEHWRWRRWGRGARRKHRLHHAGATHPGRGELGVVAHLLLLRCGVPRGAYSLSEGLGDASEMEHHSLFG